MILSKGNLQAIGIIQKDKNTPVLANLLITKEAASVAASRNTLLIVSPVNSDLKRSLPLKETKVNEDLMIHESSINDMIKNIPADKLFNGKLEHLDIDSEAKVTLHDGRLEKHIIGKKIKFNQTIPYKDICKRVLGKKENFRMVGNLSRIRLMLETLEKVSGDTSGELPLYIELSKDNEIIFRIQNAKTAQRALGIITTYKGFEGKFLEEDNFEKNLKSKFKIKVKVRK